MGEARLEAAAAPGGPPLPHAPPGGEGAEGVEGEGEEGREGRATGRQVGRLQHRLDCLAVGLLGYPALGWMGIEGGPTVDAPT